MRAITDALIAEWLRYELIEHKNGKYMWRNPDGKVKPLPNWIDTRNNLWLELVQILSEQVSVKFYTTCGAVVNCGIGNCHGGGDTLGEAFMAALWTGRKDNMWALKALEAKETPDDTD